MIIVRAVNDLCVKVLSSDNPLYVGKFMLYPNSVRRDIPFAFAAPDNVRISPTPFLSKGVE